MFDDEMTEESEVVCDTHPLGTLLEVDLEMTIVVFLVVDGGRSGSGRDDGWEGRGRGGGGYVGVVMNNFTYCVFYFS